jgi:hypothetical protein
MQLEGAAVGFSAFGDFYSHNDLIFYAITDGTNYEIGSGQYQENTYNELVRFPFRSTNGDGLVSWTDGVKEIYVTYPATHSVYTASGLDVGYNAPQASGLAFWESEHILNYDSGMVWDSTNKRIGLNQSTPVYAIEIGGEPHAAIIHASGFITDSSGVFFPSGNSIPAYSGGRQIEHFLRNELDSVTGTSSVFQLSGVVDERLLFQKQAKGHVLAGPPSGCGDDCSPNYPSFRYLTFEDLPDLSSLYVVPHNSPAMSGVAFWHESGVLSYDPYFVYNTDTNYLGINIQTPLTTLDVGGSTNIRGNITVSGNADIHGNLTYINSSTVTLGDKNLELGSLSGVAMGDDSLIDGAGITVLSTDGNKEWKWVNSTDAWTTTQKIDVSGIVGLQAGSGLTLRENSDGQLLLLDIDDMFTLIPDGGSPSYVISQDDKIVVSGVKGITTTITSDGTTHSVIIDPTALSGQLAASSYAHWVVAGDTGSENILDTNQVTFAGGRNVDTTYTTATNILSIDASGYIAAPGSGIGLATSAYGPSGQFYLDDPASLTGGQVNESDIVTQSAFEMLVWDDSASLWKYITVEDLQDEIDTSSGGEANEDSFKTITVNDSDSFLWTTDDIFATTTTDELKLIAGINIALASDVDDRAIRITATDTTYTGGTGITLNTLEFDIDPTLISARADVTSVDADYVLLWQASSSELKKVDAGEFRGGGGGSMSDFIITDGSTPQTVDDGETITFADGVGAEFVTSATNTVTVNSVDGEIVHDNLSGFVENKHIDWTASSAGTIHATNYTDTTYTGGTGITLNTLEFDIDPTLISARADVTSVDADYLLLWQASSSELKKVDAGEFRGAGGGSMSTFIVAATTGPSQTVDDGETITFADGVGAEFVVSATNTVTVNSVDGEIVHDSLSGFVANEHIDHTSVSITAGDGLSGGGTIASTRTLTVDIAGSTTKATPILADQILISDSADSDAIKEITFTKLKTLIGAGTTYTASTPLVLAGTEFTLKDPATLNALDSSTLDPGVGDDKLLVWDEGGDEWKSITIYELDAAIDTVGAGGDNAYKFIAVDGESTIGAGSTTDTLTLVEGNGNIAITTSEGGVGADTITFTTTDTNTQLTEDQVDDFVNGLIVAGDSLTKTYDDTAGTLTLDATDTTYTATTPLVLAGTEFTLDDPINLSQLTESTDATDDKILLWDENDGTGEWKYMTLEDLKDSIDPASPDSEPNENSFETIEITNTDSGFTWATADVVADTATDTVKLVAGTNITLASDATNDAIRITATDTNTQLTDGYVEGLVGDMVTGNLETLITVTYEDSDGTLDFVVDNDLSNYDNSSAGFITTNQLTTFNIGVDTDTNPTVIAHGETLTVVGGTGLITETTADGTVTVNSNATTGSGVITVVEEYRLDPNWLTASGVTYNVSLGTHAVESYDLQVSTYTNVIGYHAGYQTTGTDYTNMIGFEAGQDSLSCDYTNMMGYQAGLGADDCNHAEMIGYQAGINSSGCDKTVMIGYEAGANAEEYANSVAIGYQAAYDIDIGESDSRYSAFIGYQAGKDAVYCDDSVGIGHSAGEWTSASKAVMVGYRAGGSSKNKYGVMIGYQAGENTGLGEWSGVLVGYSAGRYANYCGNIVAIGNDAAGWAKGASGVMIGHMAGYGAGTPLRTEGAFERGGSVANAIFMGSGVGSYVENSEYITLIGADTGSGIKNSNWLDVLGYAAGKEMHNCSGIVAIGRAAGRQAGTRKADGSLQIGNVDCNFFGRFAGRYASDNHEVHYMGYKAGHEATGVWKQVCIGSQAGMEMDGAQSGVFIGHKAGKEDKGTYNLSILANGNTGDRINGGSENSKFNIANVIAGDHSDGDTNLSATFPYKKRVSIGVVDSTPSATLQITPADTVTTQLTLAPFTSVGSQSNPMMVASSISRSYNGTAGNTKNHVIDKHGFLRLPIYAAVANLPSPDSDHDGEIAIYLTSGAGSAGVLVYNDGTNWRRSDTGASV